MLNQCLDYLHKLFTILTKVKNPRSKLLINRELYGVIRSIEIIQKRK